MQTAREENSISIKYKSEVKNLNFYYGAFHALKNIHMALHDKKITALIGPSGCGKSTFLRCFNRMHDLYPGNRYDGEIILHPDDVNILDQNVDPIEVRMRISMVFQNLILFLSRFMKMLRMDYGSGESNNGRFLMNEWNWPYEIQRCGMKSKIVRTI